MIAHRGASAYETENSLIAIKKAIELNADRIEIDVRITSDDEIIVMHDEKINRTTKGFGLVNKMSFAEIKKIKIKHTDEFVPTLQEVINVVKGKCKLNIEIKELKATDKTVELIKMNQIVDETIVSSFSKEILFRLKELSPKIKRALLYSKPKGVISAAKELELYSIHPFHQTLTKRIVNSAHELEIKINSWGAYNRKSVLRLITLGVDGIITNDPLLYEKKLGISTLVELLQCKILRKLYHEVE